MCGLVGFFVACDIQIACPKKLSCLKRTQYMSKFSLWDSKACVRSAPDRTRTAQVFALPEALVPILKHPLVSALPPCDRKALQEAALFRFLNFTYKLEIAVVNTVTAKIALGAYNLSLPNTLRLDAHRIYTDEAYHALVAFEMMLKVRQSTRFPGSMPEVLPAFVNRFKTIADNHCSTKTPLLELFFVIVSEMLITSTLREAWRQHAFFKNILFHQRPI